MPMMMTTLPNHYMFDVIDDAIYWLVQAGIPQYWYNYHEWYRFFGHYKVKNYKELERITLNDLSFGFTIWLVACGISILVFLIELRIWPKRKKIAMEKWKADDDFIKTRHRKLKTKSQKLKTKFIKVRSINEI